ncbi:MAG: glycosyltransferase family 39 protein [Desulfobacterales bacterium]|nr:glycosyltransferase family 39 protein [Desulfobacterales bacterium]
MQTVKPRLYRITLIQESILFSKVNNRTVIFFGLFFLALIVRLVYWYLHTDLSFGMVSVVGTPFSDAQGYNKLAMDIAEGKGLTGAWSARRPLYPILLACFYTWFGPSFTIAKLVNITSGALAIPFVYLIGERVFTSRLMGMAVALVLAFSLKHMNYALTIMSEPTGFLLFVVSVYFILSGLDTRNKRSFFAGGVFFAVSNLVRTLTLPAFPAYILCMFYFLRKAGISPKQITYSIAVFCLGVGLCLTPWLVRQKAVHGILSIGDNAAFSFYAATSPKYGTWSGEVTRETHEKGLMEIKERYDYCMDGAIKNLKQYPLFYAKNVSFQFFRYLRAFNSKELVFYSSCVLLLALLFILRLPLAATKTDTMALSCLFIGIVLILHFLPASLGYIPVTLGMVLAIAAIYARYSLILASTFIFTGLGLAVLGGGPFERIFVLIGWVFQFFYLFAFLYIFEFLSNVITSKDRTLALNREAVFQELPGNNSLDFEPQIKKGLNILALAVIIFFAVSGIKLLYLNYAMAHPRGPSVLDLSLEERQEVLRDLNPNLHVRFSESEINDEKAFVKKVEYKDHGRNSGKILIKKGQLSEYAYYLKKDQTVRHWSRLFYPRPYERTVYYVEGIGYVLFPGKKLKRMYDKDLIFVGRYNVDTRHVYQGRIIVEGIAIVPINETSNRPDLENALVTGNRFHWGALDQVAGGAKPKRGSPVTNSGDVTAAGVIEPNVPVGFHVESEIDDSNLQDPSGYRSGSISGFFNKKIVIENIGDHILEEFTFIVNKKDFRTFGSLSEYLTLDEDRGAAVKSLYTFWKDHRFHASSLTGANNNPFYAMNFWGYTLCDDDANALAQVLAFMDIPARQIHLNGHVVCEYLFSGKWNVIDGDQNVVYLKLDNRTLASFDEITDDPFVALRTKVYGKYEEYDIEKSWKNSSLFEFISPRKSETVLLDKSGIGDLGDRKWTLYPGEKIIFHYDQSPQTAVGKSDISAWKGAKETALGIIELVLSPQTRRRLTGTDKVSVNTPYPIYRVADESGRTLEVPKEEIRLQLELSIPEEEQQLRVYCQGARASFPILLKGQNDILLSAGASKGKAKVSFVYQTLADNRSLPEVYVKNEANVFQYESPSFQIDGSKGIERVWWQISGQSDFRFVIPNFERVQAFSSTVGLSKMTDTFFISNEPYFFRVKAKRNGIWGNWSPVFQFRVVKPDQPYNIECELNSDGKVKLHWYGAKEKNTEYLIYGSNRLDFIPDIYCELEITEMVNGEVLKSRPNRNFILSTREHSCTFSKCFNFYRIVAKIGDALSTPSTLIRLRSNDQEILPGKTASAAKVLQTRWSKIEDKTLKLGYKDIYRATEMVVK